MNEEEIAARRTIMVMINGVLHPREIAYKRHNKHRPKKTKIIEDTMTEKLTNEDSESRSLRANEYQLHSNSIVKPTTKVRIKNKKTGATVGIHPDFKAASLALAKHPEKHKLFIEGYYMDKLAFARDLIESRKEVTIQESSAPLKFSDYRQVFDEQVALVESQIQEKKQLLLDKKKVVNDIEVDGTNESVVNEEKFVNVATSQKIIRDAEKALKDSPNMWAGPKASFKRLISVHKKHIQNATKKVDESVFDWKNKKSDIDWSNVRKNDEPEEKKPAKAEVDPAAPKRGRGRPPGSYGKYKVNRTPEEKKAIGAKVHGSETRKANYDETIALRKKFKAQMDDALKAKQAKLASAK